MTKRLKYPELMLQLLTDKGDRARKENFTGHFFKACEKSHSKHHQTFQSTRAKTFLEKWHLLLSVKESQCKQVH